MKIAMTYFALFKLNVRCRDNTFVTQVVSNLPPVVAIPLKDNQPVSLLHAKLIISIRCEVIQHRRPFIAIALRSLISRGNVILCLTLGILLTG